MSGFVSPPGGTLDTAYNFGGPGAGRSVAAINNAVLFASSANDANNVLELSKAPVAPFAGSALSISAGANATSPAVFITHAGAGGGIAVNVADASTSPAISASCTTALTGGGLIQGNAALGVGGGAVFKAGMTRTAPMPANTGASAFEAAPVLDAGDAAGSGAAAFFANGPTRNGNVTAGVVALQVVGVAPDTYDFTILTIFQQMRIGTNKLFAGVSAPIWISASDGVGAADPGEDVRISAGAAGDNVAVGGDITLEVAVPGSGPALAAVQTISGATGSVRFDLVAGASLSIFDSTATQAFGFDGTSHELRFYGTTAGYSGFVAAATTTSVTYTLPTADGSAGQALSTNGAGVLSWITVGGGGGVTLDGAYDFGGAGAGRTINADSGAVVITTAAANNNNVLELTKNPAGAQSGAGLFVTMGATTTGAGVSVSMTAGSSGAAGLFAGGNVVAQDATSTYASFNSATRALLLHGSTSGTTGFKAPATVTSVTYTLPTADGTAGQVLSTNGAGVLSWAAGGGGATLQTAYDAGNTIAATAARPIAFNNAVDTTDLLTLTRTFPGSGNALFVDMGATTTDHGILVTMTAGATGLAALFSGASISCPSVAGSERFGAFATATGLTGASAFGNSATASGDSSSAFGASSTASAFGAIAIGHSTTATVSGAVAIGYSSDATDSNAVAVGTSAQATAANAISLGAGTASAANAIAIGTTTTASGSASVAIGQTSTATATSSIAVGSGAQALEAGAMALGGGCIVAATHADSIAIGNSVITTASGQVVFGSATSPLSTLYFGRGVSAAAPSAFVTLQATNGSGVAGGGLRLASGVSTVAATGSNALRLAVAVAGTGTALTDVLYVNSVEGSVLIGTATPVAGKKLVVSGDVKITGVLDPTALELATGTNLYIDSTDGSTAAVAAAGHGRMAYNDTSKAWRASVDGGAYSNVITAATITTTAFVQNGNAFAGLATLGTTDANALSLITSNTARARILSGGAFLIGATTQGASEGFRQANGTSLFGGNVTISNSAVGAAGGLGEGFDLVEDGATASVAVTNYGVSGVTFSPGFAGRAARGTLATPTAVQTDDLLVSFNGRGYGATAWASGSRGRFGICAAEAWTDSAQGTYLEFSTTATGTATNTARVRLNPNGTMAWQTGGTYSATSAQLLGPTDTTFFISAGQTAATTGRALTLTGGAALAASGAAGGAFSATAGVGDGAGSGGAAQVTGGAGGATGAGGVVTITGGAGGGTSGNGGAVTVAGGTPTDGDGGAVTNAGTAGVGTNRAGGSNIHTAGNATGSAAAGSITGTAGRSVTGTAGAITWTAGQGGSTSGAGGIASLIGGAGAAGNSAGGVSRVVGGAGHGSAAGGAAQVTGGAGGATGAGGAVTITAGAGGATSGAAGAITLAGGTPVSGAGGSITLTASAGVAGNNIGGTISGTAGNAVGSGAAGSVTWTAGRSVTGTAGAATITAGQGGSTSGAGGIASLIGGAGAAGNAAGGVSRVVGGAGQGSAAGGAAQVTGGAGGATGAGGAVTITSGAGGATSGAAGAITLAGGTPVDGNGSTITLTASNGVGTNRNGGTINLVCGTATGSGTPGTIQFSGVTTWATQAQVSLATDTTSIAQFGFVDAIIDKTIVPTINDRSLTYQYRPTGTSRTYSPVLGVGTIGTSAYYYSFSEAETSDAAFSIQAGSTAVSIMTMSLPTVLPLKLSHYDNAGAGTTTDYLTLDPADVSLKLGVSGGKMGFYGATVIAKPTVTGSRGGNAALASLLTELQNLGLIIDSSSA